MAKYGMDDYVLKSQAETLRANNLLGHLLDELEETAIKNWIATTREDKESREDAYHEYQGVVKIRTMIDNTLTELEDVTDPQGD